MSVNATAPRPQSRETKTPTRTARTLTSMTTPSRAISRARPGMMPPLHVATKDRLRPHDTANGETDERAPVAASVEVPAPGEAGALAMLGAGQDRLKCRQGDPA